MSEPLISIGIVLAAYLLGSVPMAYILGRLVAGIDIREYGSGNVGTSNFAMHVGKKWIVPLVMIDVFVKGTLPVVAAGPMMLDVGSTTAVLASLAAICGHNWPVFLKFSGGRGLAVGLGALLAYGIPLFVLWASIPGIVFTLTPWRDSAVLWLLATLLLPIWVLWAGYDWWIAIFGIGFALTTIIRRATSNGFQKSLATHDELTRWRLIWNRTIFDRDIASRDLWVHSRPSETGVGNRSNE